MIPDELIEAFKFIASDATREHVLMIEYETQEESGSLVEASKEYCRGEVHSGAYNTINAILEGRTMFYQHGPGHPGGGSRYGCVDPNHIWTFHITIRYKLQSLEVRALLAMEALR